ncbi:hypothetical protein [Pedobacter sp. Leaf194]|uniref:hypothetical protein n=1 Tax=Pedobacter sp. Leaf194 TaxID=1736297 RepID=UPI0007024BE7|nr:hypothetical protein [Pedobacter sp. Leaf194]KQS37024.1 hypothetical protein ASG14_08340 [Pedobacter sp. Leaf194]
MQNLTIQELFDNFERLNKEVDVIEKEISEIEFDDHSTKEFITADQAEQYLQDAAAFELRQNELEKLKQQVIEVADILSDKLCRVNTKVKLIDKDDNCEVLVYCSEGSIIVEDCKSEEKEIIVE